MEIPIFTSQLEKAREATDAANLRAAYAEVVTNQLTNAESKPVTVTITQQKEGWQDSNITKIGEVVIANDSVLKDIKVGATITVKYENDKVVFESNK